MNWIVGFLIIGELINVILNVILVIHCHDLLNEIYQVQDKMPLD